MYTVSIDKVEPAQTKGNLKALITASIEKESQPFIKLTAIRVIQKENERAYIQFPGAKGSLGNWCPAIQIADKLLLDVIKTSCLVAYYNSPSLQSVE